MLGKAGSEGSEGSETANVGIGMGIAGTGNDSDGSPGIPGNPGRLGRLGSEMSKDGIGMGRLGIGSAGILQLMLTPSHSLIARPLEQAVLRVEETLEFLEQ